jgi:outer membrane protein assembly factor BamB
MASSMKVSGSAEGIRARSRWPAAIAALSLLGGLGVVACGGAPVGSELASVSCSVPSASAASSPTTAAAKAQSVVAPVWAAAVGRPSTVVGGTAYGTGSTDGNCITAIDVATGRVEWTVPPPAGHPSLFDVVADASTVLAATGANPGNGPGLDAPTVNQLAAYDSATGRLRWEVALPDDGQQMPGLLAGSFVVVAEADGSLLGLSESNGHQIWRDRAPKACAAGTQDGLQPNAAVLGLGPIVVGAPTVIATSCAEAGGIVAIDAATGARRWTWNVPKGWELDPQMSDTVSTGASGGIAVAAVIGLIPPANAPATVAPAPGPLLPTTIANVYGYAETDEVVMLDAFTGRALWDLTDVVGQLLPVGGAGSICVLTDAGADCRSAADGAARWSMDWAADNASASHPAMQCMDQAGSAQSCAVAADGLLYLALPTASAPGYLPLPGPSSPAGTFVVTALRMDTGKVVTKVPLPAFVDAGSSIATSLSAPPAVLVAADGLVLVTPDYEETDVVEAFTNPT